MDSTFIQWLMSQDIFPTSMISSVYYPCWKGDYTTARSWENPGIDTYEKYVDLLQLTKRAGIEPEVLMQGLTPVDEKIIRRYLDLGIRKFTISNDETATMIKEIDPDVFISASIVKALSPEEIANNDYSMYDEICLFFYYTLNLSAVKELPSKYQYSMCMNSGCLPFCKYCVNHWISDEMYDCFYRGGYGLDEDKWNITVGYKEYEEYFAKYIKRLKVLDRLNSKEDLINTFTEFFANPCMRSESYFDRKMSFPNIYKKGAL